MMKKLHTSVFLLVLMSLSITTYNCTGMNDFIHEHLDVQSPDILLLQETWLLNKDLSKLNHLHSGYQGRGVSGVPENGEILRGRPYGGLAVVYKKSLASAIHTSNTESTRIYEAVLTLQDKNKTTHY